MNEKILGGYVKAENIRKVINRLTDIRFDTKETLKVKQAEVDLMVELDVISEDQAKFMTDMFKRVG